MAASNWSGLANFCLGQDQRKGINQPLSRVSRAQGARGLRSQAMPLRRYSAAFSAPTTKPVLRYMPTYRLESKIPFNKEVCEKIMKSVVDRAFEDYVYKPKQALIYAAQVSEEIKNRVKVQNYDRYRYVCVVTIGEKLMQGFNALVNFLWDADKDGLLSYVYDKPEFFALTTFYYIYYD